MKEKDPSGIEQHQPGAKLDAGKIKAGLLSDFSRALMAVAEVGTYGVEKYTRNGWRQVDNGIERYGDAAWRHLLRSGFEETDKDSGLLHAAQHAWNALACLELMLTAKQSRAECQTLELSVAEDEVKATYQRAKAARKSWPQPIGKPE